jgi:hypothetical protein
MASTGISGLTLPKATLTVVDGAGVTPMLKFQFNPTEYTVSKSARWNRTPTRGAESATEPDYVGTNPTSVTMQVFFDASELPGGDVSADVSTLMEWTRPTPVSQAMNRGQPPLLRFIWGMNPVLQSFQGYLKSVRANYTMFRMDGTPIRATANISLEEVTERVGPQNPTSGSREGRRSRQLAEGDSLASVAYQELGDAALWRGLAEFNGIDDPMRVTPGTRLLIPTPAEARRLSAVPS